MWWQCRSLTGPQCPTISSCHRPSTEPPQMQGHSTARTSVLGCSLTMETVEVGCICNFVHFVLPPENTGFKKSYILTLQFIFMFSMRNIRVIHNIKYCNITKINLCIQTRITGVSLLATNITITIVHDSPNILEMKSSLTTSQISMLAPLDCCHISH